VRDRADTSAWDRRRRAPPRAVVDVADTVALTTAVADVYPRLADAGFVAACLPGLVPGSLAANHDGSYAAAVRQTVVGVTATWQLRVTVEPDEPRHRVDIYLSGSERRLRMTMLGGAGVTVAQTNTASSKLTYTGHVEVEGRLAAAGGPIIRRLVGETLQRFVARLGAA
jgi:carbon monoxide dehydrogenase subunit G